MARKDGSDWHAWAMLCGLPATLVTLAAAPPVGLALLGATVVAFKHGNDLDAEAALEEREKQDRYARDERAKRLEAARTAWDAELEALNQAYDNGEISDEENDARFDELVDRYPR